MFAGILSIEQPLSAWGEPARIADALAPYSTDKPRDFWRKERQMLLQVATRTGAASVAIYQHPESGVAVAYWGRLDNRPDLISQLEAQHNASDDELIALAWLKWGELCPEQLIGDFALAVASPKTGANDPCHYPQLCISDSNSPGFFVLVLRPKGSTRNRWGGQSSTSTISLSTSTVGLKKLWVITRSTPTS